MINIYKFNNVLMIAVNEVTKLAEIKPFKVNQGVQRLIAHRLIDAPYKNKQQNYIKETDFLELSRFLNLSPELHEAVILSFKRSEAGR